MRGAAILLGQDVMTEQEVTIEAGFRTETGPNLRVSARADGLRLVAIGTTEFVCGTIAWEDIDSARWRLVHADTEDRAKTKTHEG